MLQVETELAATEKLTVEAYKIIISQRTRNYAPGLLFSKDERGFTRFEGYLQLFFF